MLDDTSIVVAENFLTKDIIKKRSSVKYMDLDSKEMKEVSELGLNEGDNNLPEEVTKDGKKYKKVIISD